MRDSLRIWIAVATVLILSSAVFAQSPSDASWRPCPRCVLNSKNAENVAKLKDAPFDPRDISGVWGNNDLLLDTKTVPPLTPWGKEQYDATKAAETQPGLAISNSKDGMLVCDPK